MDICSRLREFTTSQDISFVACITWTVHSVCAYWTNMYITMFLILMLSRVDLTVLLLLLSPALLYCKMISIVLLLAQYSILDPILITKVILNYNINLYLACRLSPPIEYRILSWSSSNINHCLQLQILQYCEFRASPLLTEKSLRLPDWLLCTLGVLAKGWNRTGAITCTLVLCLSPLPSVI